MTDAAPQVAPPTEPPTKAAEPEQRKFNLPKKEKVCIVGCAESKSLAPYHLHAEMEFWGVNNLHLSMPIGKFPWSRWFETHRITVEGGRYLRRGKPDFRGQPIDQYLMSLQALNIPVYMQQPVHILPNAVRYPLEEMCAAFPRRYFTNTISYEIALALSLGFKEIHIYGVDMAVSSPLRGQNEYSHQRPSCEYFIGIAEGRGIKVVVPDECDLLKTNFLYSFEEHKEDTFISKLRELDHSMEHRQAESERQKAMAEQKVQQYIGARAVIGEISKIRTNLQEQSTWKYGQGVGL